MDHFWCFQRKSARKYQQIKEKENILSETETLATKLFFLWSKLVEFSNLILFFISKHLFTTKLVWIKPFLSLSLKIMSEIILKKRKKWFKDYLKEMIIEKWEAAIMSNVIITICIFCYIIDCEKGNKTAVYYDISQKERKREREMQASVFPSDY